MTCNIICTLTPLARKAIEWNAHCILVYLLTLSLTSFRSNFNKTSSIICFFFSFFFLMCDIFDWSEYSVYLFLTRCPLVVKHENKFILCYVPSGDDVRIEAYAMAALHNITTSHQSYTYDEKYEWPNLLQYAFKQWPTYVP